MNNSDSLQPFRLALSYLEKVEQELAKWDEVRAARNSDVTTFDHVRSAYFAHQRAAQEVVDAYRADAKKDLETVEEELRLERRAHRKFLEQAAAGDISAKEANAKNRELTESIESLELRLATAQAINAADSSEDVGGFIALPLDDYKKKLVPPSPRDPEEKRSFEMPSLSASAVIMGAIIIIALGVYVYFTSGGSVRVTFEGELVAGESELIQVTCRNVGKRPLNWYVPWPEGNPRSAGMGSAAYGVLLYVLEEEGNSPKLVPNSEGCWHYRGLELVDAEPIEVRPRLAARVVLDLDKLREVGVEARVVRIVFTRQGGGEVGRFETVLE